LEAKLRIRIALAGAWLVAIVVGLTGIWIERTSGWGSALGPLIVGVLALVLAVAAEKISRRREQDWHALAQRIEAQNPELNGRLMTAVQQQGAAGELSYLQQRVVQEALLQEKHSDWTRVVPQNWLRIAQVANFVLLMCLLAVLSGLRSTGVHALLAKIPESSVTITPGDTTIEKGNSLVVLARFGGALPPNVTLVLESGQDSAQKVSLAKSLADPIFGGTVPEVVTNLSYHVEYGGSRSKDYHVTVFEYPRLERADADLAFPEYTGQAPKRIEDTRRLSAVEGSQLKLSLQLNKPVVSAVLISKDKKPASVTLSIDTNRPVATLKGFDLQTSKTYELHLTDAEGRTNKVAAQFVFHVLTNQAPELRLTSPAGDVRVSALEELSFKGTVWDDFGVKAYGLGFSVPGKETRFVELGQAVPAKEKHAFEHLLRLEELGLQPDQFISWFVWGDDVGPDGKIRRTTSDLFFGEIRPFEEVFREGQGMDGGQQQQGGQSGQQKSPTDKLTELQKQIINATWRLKREHPGKTAPEAKTNESSAVRSTKVQFAHDSSSFPFRLRPARVSNVMGQVAAADNGDPDLTYQPPARRGRPRQAASTNAPPTYETDAVVVRDSQEDALSQAEATSRRVNDPRAAVLWSTAKRQMEEALSRLDNATNSPGTLPEALASEQAAYESLLKLQQHEYQVVRNRNRHQGGGGSRDQQMQRQLEQMDMTQSDNRYETQRQAQRPQTNERREQQQVQSRLQELARRQQDLNERLKELQTALQEAKTPEEREEILRRLKRLQEEEQQMLADVDELKQRMDQPQNQSQMANERQQLDQTRQDVQRAADQAGSGSPSQALASGTRAQRQFQQMQDQMRKQNSSQFGEDLKKLRADARELSKQQQDILKKIENEAGNGQKSLSDSPDRKEALQQLEAQRGRMTNLVARATDISQQAEEAEPLVSRKLYDSVRKFTQDTAKSVQEAQEDLLSHGLMTRDLYDRLKNSSEPDGTKLLDITSEMVRSDFLRQAKDAGQRASAPIENLKKGVETAAEGVLGDDTEALKLAQEQLNQLTDQLQREMAVAQGQTNGEGAETSNSKNQTPGKSQTANSKNGGRGAQGQNGLNQAGNQGGNTNQPGNAEGQRASNKGQGGGQQANQNGGGQKGNGSDQATGPSEQGKEPTEQANNQSQQTDGQSGQQNESAQGQRGAGAGNARQAQRGNAARNGNRYGADAGGGGGDGGDISGSLGRVFDRLAGDNPGPLTGPITGQDYVPWADRLRDVQEMIDSQDLRNSVATARERARLLRQEYKRDLKKPDWAVVRMQVMKPLMEVRDQIADELARRQSQDALVPIDRDPVPARYSELVKKYYEELGK